MLSVTSATSVLVATSPVDLRGSFNRLYSLVVEQLKGDPLSGHLFVFTNRRRNRIKVLYWDGYGNTEIMGRQFRPKGRFRGKTVFPVRDDVPIIIALPERPRCSTLLFRGTPRARSFQVSERLLLHVQIRLDITVSRADLFVAQPERDDLDCNPSLQQMHGAGVAPMPPAA